MACLRVLGVRVRKFYFLLWLQWAVKLSLYTTILAAVIAVLITLGLYIDQGMKALNKEVYLALFAIFKFWFALSWGISLLIMLFRSLKFIFNQCISGYKFELLTCSKEDEKEKKPEAIKNIGYGDLVKVWRKWLMLIIWIVAAEMIFALVSMKFLSSYENVFDWFNIYLLYIFILIAGYLSFIVLSMKCKKVRIVRC